MFRNQRVNFLNSVKHKLTTVLHFSNEQVLLEIDSLNDHMLKALEALCELGLRGEHLRRWEKPADFQDNIFEIENEFLPSHRDALIFLIKTKKIEPQDAVNMISGFTTDQAGCLESLYDLGIRTEMLRGWSPPADNEPFSAKHEYALKMLINNQVSPLQAMQMITGKSGHDALLLIFTFEKYKHLAPYKENIARSLQDLSYENISLEDLTSWHSIEFCTEHAELIPLLKRYRCLSATDAIKYCCDAELTATQAKGLSAVVKASKNNMQLASMIKHFDHHLTEKQLNLLFGTSEDRSNDNSLSI